MKCGVKPNDGLISFLKAEKNLCEAIQTTNIAQLSVLPCGVSPDHPSKLMASKKMRYMIEELKSCNKELFIVFDSTPVQQTSEPTILSKQVDAILLVVRAGKTNREMVKKTLDTLGREKVMGIIFNYSNEVIRRRYKYYYQIEKIRG